VPTFLPFLIAIAAAAIVLRRTALPERHHAVVYGVSLALGFGQAFNAPRDVYPLDSWRMYSSTNAPREYYDFAVTVEQAEMRYPFSFVAPLSPGPLDGYSMLSPIPWRLIALRSRCVCAANDVALDTMILGLVSVFEQRQGVVADAFTIYAVPSQWATGPQVPPVALYRWSRF